MVAWHLEDRSSMINIVTLGILRRITSWMCTEFSVPHSTACYKAAVYLMRSFYTNDANDNMTFWFLTTYNKGPTTWKGVRQIFSKFLLSIFSFPVMESTNCDEIAHELVIVFPPVKDFTLFDTSTDLDCNLCEQTSYKTNANMVQRRQWNSGDLFRLPLRR